MVETEQESEFDILSILLLFLTHRLFFRLVSENGGKVKVMELMAHESSDVKYQALITVCAELTLVTRTRH
jgi:hypothetical protein